VPVGQVDERGQRVTAGPREVIARDRRGGEQADEDDEQHSRQQPARAPHPERFEADAPLATALCQQQRGDQITAEHEEHVDAEEAPGHPGDAGVIEHDTRDRERAQTVEAGSIGQLRTNSWRPARDGDGGLGRARKASLAH